MKTDEVSYLNPACLCRDLLSSLSRREQYHFKNNDKYLQDIATGYEVNAASRMIFNIVIQVSRSRLYIVVLSLNVNNKRHYSGVTTRIYMRKTKQYVEFL